MKRGVFITGTGTGVGKTIVAACCVRRWHARYWKPAQTGTASGDDDTACVAALAQVPLERLHTPRHRFAAPLSVEAAAALEGDTVSLTDFELPPGDAPIVVEGAGGVLVPIGPGCFMVDLMRRLGLPVLLVSRTALGTINHTLLSLESLRTRLIAVAGVIMVGDRNDGNADAIVRHGMVRVVHWLPRLSTVTHETIAQAAAFFPDLDSILE